MPYCPACGEQVSAGAKFCEKCGSPVNTPSAATQTESHAQVATAADLSNDPVLKDYSPIEPPPDLPFRLQEGEVIYKNFRPSSRVVVKFAFGGVVTFIVLAVFLYYLGSILAILPQGSPGRVDLLVMIYGFWAFAVLILAFGIIGGFMAYRKYSYWITNMRTVGRRGLIGYSTDSMPYDNVADVIIMRGALDRLLGISSVYIQPYGGAGYINAPGGAATNRLTGSNTFLGLIPSEAPEIQRLIFHLRELKKQAKPR